MNYRHAFHAGNFADVVKHLALAAVILHLRRKEKAFCVIDTHAGAGLYDLAGAEAVRAGEAATGVGRLRGLGRAGTAEALGFYLDCVEREGEGRYPGSPRIAARLLRPQDRLVAIEKHPGHAAALRSALSEFRNIRVVEGDGYERLPALLPPAERRGVILIDPPYEADDEFGCVAQLLADAHRRFATGIYLLWFPVKSKGAANAFCGEVRTRVPASMLRLDIDLGRPADSEKERLSAAGLLVVNPPFGFEGEINAAAAILSPLLGRTTEHPAMIALAAV
jgi:23S rRNA (adenine2030-N6)-methyltransferase